MDGSKEQRQQEVYFQIRAAAVFLKHRSLPLITPHIKALIKGSVSRLLLWLKDIFQDSALLQIFVGGGTCCMWRPCGSWLRSYFTWATERLASITSITVVTKLRLCRNPSGGFLGLQRRPLQLVDRPSVHDMGHLEQGLTGG